MFIFLETLILYTNLKHIGKFAVTRNNEITHVSYNGIDRLDSSLGYTKDNIVTCCKICNYAKNKMKFEDFKMDIEST